jgi:hypothetical protein
MPKQMVAVSYEVPGPDLESLPFKSNGSILDADIVIFCPTLQDYETDEPYAGQPLISDSDSDQLRQHTLHWKSELTLTLEHGKTVFLFLEEIADCHMHTGQRNISSSGRSITNLVLPYEPYSSVPLEGLVGRIHRSQGGRIKPTVRLGSLSSYWNDFGPYSYYDVYLDRVTVPCLLTQTGDKVVGGFIRSKAWKGTMVLLPLVDFGSMIEEREKQFSKRAKTKSSRSIAAKEKAKTSVGRQFVDALIQIDKMVRVTIERTPAPMWSTEAAYSLQEEVSLMREISRIEKEITKLGELRKAAQEKLEAAGNLRGLLYETGKPLESAVLEALRILDFQAENYKDADSEFDVLFVDPEGERLLGEAEGKNDKAINIDKLDQLNRNVQEEFAKRSDAKYSKGVLFGNAFRLTPLNERGEFFTEKCLAGAARLGFSLVRTPDLFRVAKYLKDNPDAEFARKCRAAILTTSGTVVAFPPDPSAKDVTRAADSTQEIQS